MFKLAACAITLSFSLPALAFDLPDGFEKIGAFSGNAFQKPIDLTSISSRELEYSDLHFMNGTDKAQRVFKAYTVRASAGVDQDGQALPPILSVEFDQDPDTGALTPARVIYQHEGEEMQYVTFPPNHSRENIEVTNLVFNDSGEISFDIKANLTLVHWDTYKRVFYAPNEEIQGHFSGNFPAFALEYPYIAGDY